MWNTKPPLLIWIQVAFMKMIGVNELSVRLPSAFAAFFTCLVLLVFSLRYLKSYWFGFIAVIVLITSEGYINLHATRTGDYDAMLTLFTTLSGLFFFAYCETKKYQHLYYFFLFMTLAVLTKSITGLMFLPAIFIYSIIRKQFIPLLKNKHFYIGLFSFMLLVIGYYLLRESYYDGYIAAVQQNELGGRFLDVIENHKHGFWFYYNNFIDFQLTSWYLLVPCGLVIGLVIKDKKIKRITLFSVLMIGTFFLIISLAQTKLKWYDVPLYPFLAIIIAVFINYVFQFLKNVDWRNKMLSANVIPYLFLFLICITPYQNILDKTYHPKEVYWDKDFYEISYYLKDAVKGEYDLNDQYLLYDGYNAHNLFYLNILNDQGVNVSVKDWRNLEKMDIVFTHQDDIIQYIKKHYIYQVVRREGNIQTCKIYESKY
jgi:4-amino-4-deoxy-L-arabinose transferase-like glycosyltransferase